MDFPDNKALMGFRSRAQSRWAHATDQWWADEYEKNTNYEAIPDKVNEDQTDGIAEWMEPLNEVHPFVGLWDKSIDAIGKVESLSDFEQWSKYFFRLGKFFKNEFNTKLVQSFLGQYTILLEVLKKWKEKAGDKISPAIKDGWEAFIDTHGNPEDDVWAPMDKAAKAGINTRVQKMNVDAFDWGVKAGQSVSDEVVDWMNRKLAPNKYLGTSFLKGMIVGAKNEIASQDTVAVNENALVRKASKITGLDTQVMEMLWEDSIKENSLICKESKKGRKFWAGVVETFKSKIRNLDIMEARRIMEGRRALRDSVEKFLNHLATGEYANAQSVVPEMVKNQLGTMINRKKEVFLKDLAKQVKEKAKEA